MKQIFTFSLFCVFISIPLKAQNINFAYDKFKDYLLTSSADNEIAKDISGNSIAIDANGDGEISEQEALNVYYLSLNAEDFDDTPYYDQESGIYYPTRFSTEELKYFSNVQFFYLEGYVRTTTSEKVVDISGLSNLIEISIKSPERYAPSVKLPDILPNLKVLHGYRLIDFDRIPNIEDLIISGHYDNITISDVQSLKKLRVPSDISGALRLTNLPNLEDFNYFSTKSNLNSAGTDLIYLENLPALKELEVTVNGTYGLSIKNLTVKDLPNLTKLDCSNNYSGVVNPTSGTGIESLTLSNLPKLTTLNCTKNLLTSLDTSNLTNLTSLDCSHNLITDLNISGNVNLTSLNCGNNSLSSIDVSNNSKLTYLNCYMNMFLQLDVSNNSELNTLHCGMTNITELDLSNNPKISDLNLTFLILKKITMKNGVVDAWLDNLPNSNNPFKVEYICCDEDEMARVKTILDEMASASGSESNTTIDSICSTLGVNEVPTTHNPDIKIYPNPVKNTLFINSEETIKKAEIFDINGRLVLSSSIKNNTIDLSFLNKGIYIISAYSDNGKAKTQFIKE